MKESKPNYPIKVLNKSLSILETLFQQVFPISMTEISEKLGLYPITIHRILIRYLKTLGVCRTRTRY